MDKATIINYIKSHKLQFISAAVVAVVGIIATIVFTMGTPQKADKAQTTKTDNEMPVDRSVASEILVGKMHYRDVCRLLPEKTIATNMGDFSRHSTTIQNYVESSIASDEFSERNPIETSCAYRGIGANSGEVKINSITYRNRDEALTAWNENIISVKRSTSELMPPILTKIKDSEASAELKKSATDFVEQLNDTTSKYVESRNPDASKIINDGTGYIFNEESEEFSFIRENSIISLDINSNMKQNSFLDSDYTNLSDLSDVEIVKRFDRVAKFFKAIDSNFKNKNISQAPINTWPRDSSIKGFEPCELLNKSLASSYLSPRQSAVVEQKTTSKDMTLTRPINNGSYTFPAENSCKRKFDQSANRVWGGEANLTIYYPKDEKSAVTLYKSFGEIYPNTPSISLSGADEAMFKNRYEYEGTTLPGILFARKKHYVIKLQLSGFNQNKQEMLYRDEQYTSIASGILKGM